MKYLKKMKNKIIELIDGYWESQKYQNILRNGQDLKEDLKAAISAELSELESVKNTLVVFQKIIEKSKYIELTNAMQLQLILEIDKSNEIIKEIYEI